MGPATTVDESHKVGVLRWDVDFSFIPVLFLASFTVLVAASGVASVDATWTRRSLSPRAVGTQVRVCLFMDNYGSDGGMRHYVASKDCQAL